MIYNYLMSGTVAEKKVYSKKTKKTTKKPVNKLTPKQQTFAAAYADPNSPTYNNGTQSAALAYDRKPDATASVYATRLLKSDNVLNAIEDILVKHDYSLSVRLADTIDLARGNTSHTSKTVNKDADGNITHISETTSEPKHSDRLKALDMINKLTGAYTIADETAKSANKRLEAMYSRMRKQVNKEKDVTGSAE